MNRSYYYSYIEEKLNTLAYRINANGKLNLLNLHVHSEDFYLCLMNLLFGWKLVNMNTSNQNLEGIDLIDHSNKLIVQVSATSTKQKVKNALSKKSIAEYSGYKFKFISISNETANLRNNTFENPHGIEFTPNDDILDKIIILRKITSFGIEKLRIIYEFIKKELGSEVDIVKLDSNLATIINILSNENLIENDITMTTDSFEIERKILFNELKTTRMIIDDYKIHYGRIDKKYKEFDKLGVNKSYAVLQSIRKQYIQLSSNLTVEGADMIFFEIIEKIKDLIINSKNYIEISHEELDVCVNIVVVDAFIRCKIFKNPEGYDYAITRQHTS